MNNIVIVSDRPYGGAAIIYKLNLNFETEIIETISDRLLICKINLNEKMFYCVMSTNNIANNDEFSDVLLKISSIQKMYDVVFARDFKCNILKKFLSINELYCPIYSKIETATLLVLL